MRNLSWHLKVYYYSQNSVCSMHNDMKTLLSLCPRRVISDSFASACLLSADSALWREGVCGDVALQDSARLPAGAGLCGADRRSW